ncbi:luciferase family protein [Thermopolyspora sp. NPDC052614]|uniref:luciferase domain-containing protein n=1 Tax=Thermopolyspora sp. NPDC052614 TaxID=3155682 RepID=UPI00343BF175
MAASLSVARDPRALYVERAIAQLREWPGVALAYVGENEVMFAANGTPVVRLVDDGLCMVHLTQPVIERLSHFLLDSGLLASLTDAGWVTMRVETTTDLDLLLALVSLAIKMNG